MKVWNWESAKGARTPTTEPKISSSGFSTHTLAMMKSDPVAKAVVISEPASAVPTGRFNPAALNMFRN